MNPLLFFFRSRYLGKVALVAFGPLIKVTTPALAEVHYEQDAYSLGFAYTGEIWRAAEGGLARGARYLDNLALVLEVDGERSLDISDLTLYAHVVYNNGRNLGGVVGDAQGVSNIETVEALRLYELWADWKFGTDADHSLLFGLYGVDGEFDVAPSAGLFIGSSHGTGAEFSQTGQQGPSIFPITSLALRYRWQLSDTWNIKAAVLDAVPGDPEYPQRTTVRFDDDDGAMLITEVSRESERLVKAAFGFWQYTARFDDLEVVDADANRRRRKGNRGAYTLTEVALLQSPEMGVPKLTAFFRYGVANGDFNRFEHYLGAGLVLRNLIKDDVPDELGLGVSHARNGDAYRRLVARQRGSVDRAETNIELTWRVPVNNWLTLQPVVQYILNPDTDPSRDNALIFGLRFEMSFDKRW